MRKFIFIVVVIVVVGAAGWGVWHFFFNPHSVPQSAVAQDASPYALPALTISYTNSTYNFSLTLPEGFSAHEVDDPDTGGATLVFQDTQGNGIQIIIGPFDEDAGNGYKLTKERILQDVPDLVINDPQPIEVGTDYTGLAFTSDNAAFDGASREVWFVFHGNLYQISTYARLDPLLKAVFATWQFF